MGLSESWSGFIKSGSTCAIRLGNVRWLKERLASLAMRREKVKEKGLITDIAVISRREGLFEGEEISPGVTGLIVLHDSKT